jgi:hypothetical protein
LLRKKKNKNGESIVHSPNFFNYNCEAVASDFYVFSSNYLTKIRLLGMLTPYGPHFGPTKFLTIQICLGLGRFFLGGAINYRLKGESNSFEECYNSFQRPF